MLRMNVSLRTAVTALAAATIGALGGCADLSKYHPYPAQYAWSEMRQDAANAGVSSQLVNTFSGTNLDLSAELDKAEADAVSAAQGETLPKRAFDDMVANLTVDLLDVLGDEAEQAEYLLYLGLGKIQTPATGPYTQEQLDAIALRIASRLQSNARFRDNFAVAQTQSSDVTSVINEVGQPAAWSADARLGEAANRIPREDLYVLTGSFSAYPERNNEKLSGTLNVTLVHALDGRTIPLPEYSVAYFYHPSLRRFLTKPENLSKLNALDEKNRQDALIIIPPEDL